MALTITGMPKRGFKPNRQVCSQRIECVQPELVKRRRHTDKQLILMEIFPIIGLPPVEDLQHKVIERLLTAGLKLIPLTVVRGVIRATVNVFCRQCQ